MQDYLIRSSALEGARDLLQSFGIDSENLLAGARIPPAASDDPDVLISYRAYVKFLELAAAASGIAHFGLLLAPRRSLAVLGLVWTVMSRAPDMRSSLEMLIRYLHHHNEAASIELATDGDLAYLSYSPRLSDWEQVRQDVDLSCGFGTRILQMLCGNSWQPQSIHFTHSAPTNVLPYNEFFGCPVYFDQRFNGTIFDVSLLDIPLADNDARIVALLAECLDTRKLDTTDSYIARVKRLSRTCMLAGDCSIDTIAHSMSTSRRSMQRELARHGQTFKGLLQEVRFAEAARFLSSSEMSMGQLAEMLAYSELSAFSRAFSKHHGISPRQWQAANRLKPASA